MLNSSNKMIKNTMKRLRFTYQDDIALLNEFLAQNPIQNPDNWNIIHENITTMQRKAFLIKTLKNRLQLLLEAWVAQEATRTTQSGVEEPYCERDHLLQEVHDLCKESQYVLKKKKVSKGKQLCLLGRQDRETFAVECFETNKENLSVEDNLKKTPENLTSDHEYAYQIEIASDTNFDNEIQAHTTMHAPDVAPPTVNVEGDPAMETLAHPEKMAETPTTAKKVLQPNRKRLNKSNTLRKGALDYLIDKNRSELTLKARDLDLQERKLAFEERKLRLDETKLRMEEKRFEMESEDRRQKLKLELETFQMALAERNTTTQLLQSQQKIIEILMKKVQD